MDALVAAITSCPSVSGMAAGGLGSAATLLPGRRVPGVRVTEGEVQVDVRARWGVTAAMLAREVSTATAAMLAGHRLHVRIADIDDPDQPAATPDTTIRATPIALPGSEPPPAVAPAPVPIALPAARPAGPGSVIAASTSPLTAGPGATAVSALAQEESANGATDPSDRPASPS